MIEPPTGDMNRRIQIYAVKSRPIAGGAQNRTETLLWACWAKFEIIGGANYWNNVQTAQEVTHRIFVRQVKGKTRPQDLPRLIEITSNGERFRVKRTTSVNADVKFTLFECEALRAGNAQDPSRV